MTLITSMISAYAKDTKDIFYCSPLKKIPADNSEQWFSCVLIGWNKLDSMVNKLFMEIGNRWKDEP